MIIFGSKMYGTKNVVHGHGECPHCGVYGRHKSYDGRKWAHVYWIPIFPEGKPVRVMKECASCNMGSHVPQAMVGQLYQRIETLMEMCVVAAGEGSRVFDDDQGVEVHNGPFLLEAVDLMYTAGYRGEVPGLIGLLDSEPSRYEHGIAGGAYAEIRGNDQDAYAQYQAAGDAAPDQPLPYLLMSAIQTRAGQPEPALQLLERAGELEPDNVQILLAKAGPLEALGRFQELTDVIDRAVQIAPELGQDKQFMKLRRKYSKKAAKAGR